MNAIPPFDAELLRRYDRPGPRYTSYPTAPHFTPRFSAADYRRAAEASNSDPIPRPLSLYLHVPFCLSPCFYCGCNRIITRDLERGERYLRYVQKELSHVAPLLDSDREVIQLHLGGGTPNFLKPELMEGMVQALGREFRFSTRADRDFSIELDPRSVNPEGIAHLASLGFNRASLGVQDFDPSVQEAVNRVQSVEETLAVVDACRAHGFRSINVDLIYGLPRQNLAGFARTLDTVIAVRPDRLAVYSYAHLPELFRAQKQIRAEDLLPPEMKLRLLELAIEKLSAAGYRYIGMDHFALPEDELSRAQERGSLQRNFMGYTTHAETDLIGLGMSSISRIGDVYAQNARELGAYEAALDAGRQPVAKGLKLDSDDLLRADLIQHLMCQGEIVPAALEERYGIEFADYFSTALAKLAPLEADGLVRIRPDRIEVTERGRMLMRLVAMCFDRHLDQQNEPLRFSKAI
ncbi:MAG: oxygen-independent coproporphyrinogen III oxidase [Aquimonas sp.]|nr:oxygen-independent coproporphyrinogen III oxidase [Aquimonas sp.]